MLWYVAYSICYSCKLIFQLGDTKYDVDSFMSMHTFTLLALCSLKFFMEYLSEINATIIHYLNSAIFFFSPDDGTVRLLILVSTIMCVFSARATLAQDYDDMTIQ